MLLFQQNNTDSNPEWRAFARQTVLVQYANSPIILALIDTFDSAVNLDEDAENFYKFAWNISTAIGSFLDIWGRIVNVSRTITVPPINYIGFKEQGSLARSFGHGALYSSQTASLNYNLSDDAYRLMILAKALFNISRTTYAVYNKILMQLFEGRGRAYIGTMGNMQARLTFEFELQPFEISILKQSNVFEPPTGVSFQILDGIPERTIGFSQQDRGAALGHGKLFRDFR